MESDARAWFCINNIVSEIMFRIVTLSGECALWVHTGSDLKSSLSWKLWIVWLIYSFIQINVPGVDNGKSMQRFFYSYTARFWYVPYSTSSFELFPVNESRCIAAWTLFYEQVNAHLWFIETCRLKVLPLGQQHTHINSYIAPVSVRKHTFFCMSVVRWCFQINKNCKYAMILTLLLVKM